MNEVYYQFEAQDKRLDPDSEKGWYPAIALPDKFLDVNSAAEDLAKKGGEDNVYCMFRIRLVKVETVERRSKVDIPKVRLEAGDVFDFDGTRYTVSEIINGQAVIWHLLYGRVKSNVWDSAWNNEWTLVEV